MAGAAWKTLRLAVDTEDWPTVVSTLQDELRCDAASDLIPVLKATIDEISRRKDGRRKGGGKGKDRGKGGDFTFTFDLDPVDSDYNMMAKLLGAAGQNVHHIQDQSGAQVWLGRENGQPCTCEISADSRAALDKAKRLAEELITTMYDEYDDWAYRNGRTKSGQSGKKNSKGKGGKGGKGRWGDGFVKYLNLDEEFDPAFRFRGKLVGEKGRNVHHIEDNSSAKVQIEQPDSEGPISVTITGDTEKYVDHAMKLLKDLISTIKEEYETWLDGGDDGARRKGKAKGKGSKKWESSKDGEHEQQIDVEKTDPAFDMKGKIIGEKGKHVHHVQDETGAKVWVDQDAKGDPINIRISSGDKDALDKAVSLVQDLVDAITEEYQGWLKDEQEEPPAKRSRT